MMIACENLVKIYKTSEIEVVALQGLDLTVESGELMAIIGNSGSGKSTLLNMLGGLDRPSAGALMVDNRNLLKMTEREYVAYKRNTVGFVWQNNARNLVPYLTAMENVEMPMMVAGRRNRKYAQELLDLVGLTGRMRSKLSQLSGGEQQRVAIAISLANRPKLLLADEPTGAVDSKTASMILDVFREAQQKLGVTIVIVTHDRMIAKKVDRVVSIRDGRTSSEFLRVRSYADQLNEIGNMFAAQQTDEDHQVELIVMDANGRIQLPREMMDKLGLQGKSRLHLAFEDGQIIIRPGEKNESKPEREKGA